MAQPTLTTSQTPVAQASTPTTCRLINETCFEFLSIEMVDYVMRTTPSGPPGAAANPDAGSNAGSEAVFYKLERLGFRVGQRLVERFTMDHTRFQDHLEVIKFICKEFWLAVFKKQVDNLRTNHKGVFVLVDNRFRWLTHLSYDQSTQKDVAIPYVMFPCGLIRGALSNLGVPAVVTAEITQLPGCTFTIKIKL